MTIEKLNENQIRCTLTSADLSSRKINLAELAYGSEKAKNLFYDMMKQARHEVGFEVNGTPLMIEAIPSMDSLTLIITKVNDPEELDTRFSSFSSSGNSQNAELHFSGADGILNLLKKIKEATAGISSGKGDKGSAAQRIPADTGSAGTVSSKKTGQDEALTQLVEAFRFTSLDDAILAAKAAGTESCCRNSLYKFDASTYLLILHGTQEDPEGFNRICNILSEYGFSEHCSEASENYLREHGCLMIAADAIQRLAAL